MIKRRLVLSPFFIALTLLLVSVPITAQSLSTSVSPVAFQQDKTRTAASAPKTAVRTSADDADNNFGSVNGRVVMDVLPSPESKASVTKGVGGTKVLLRRLDGGMASFLFERLSDADGKYDFQFIRAGRYTLEIDRATLPSDIPYPARKIAIIDIAVSKKSHFDIYIPTQRMITGIVFTDVDGDGKYQEGKDRPVEGALITANGSVATSDARGSYVLSDLPPGRIGMLVTDPKKNENTHVLLDLGSSPVAKRIVNVPMTSFTDNNSGAARMVKATVAPPVVRSQTAAVPTVGVERKHYLASPLIGEAYRRELASRPAIPEDDVVPSRPIVVTSTLVTNTAMVRPRYAEANFQTGTSMLLEEKRLMAAAGNDMRGFSTGDSLIDAYIVDSSRRHSIDPLLIYAQMGQESAFKQRALSNKGASGLMQLMPATARRLGVTNIYDPKQNIEGGVKYMRILLDMFGDVNLALAGYNAGEGAVIKYGYQIPPYNETKDYVRRISARYRTMARPTVATRF